MLTCHCLAVLAWWAAGDNLSAEEAEKAGLVSKVIPADELVAAAIKVHIALIIVRLVCEWRACSAVEAARGVRGAQSRQHVGFVVKTVS